MKNLSVYYSLFLLIINIVNVMAGSSNVSIKSEKPNEINKKVAIYATDNIMSNQSLTSSSDGASLQKNSSLPFSRLYDVTFGAFFIKLIVQTIDGVHCGCLIVKRCESALSKIYYNYTPERTIHQDCMNTQLQINIINHDATEEHLIMSKKIRLDRNKTKSKWIQTHAASHLSFDINLQRAPVITYKFISVVP